MEIECLANPPGTPDDRYRHVEAAIAVIERSGLRYEVEALGTTIEGEPDQLWPLLRAVHEACLEAGADSLVTVVKVAQTSSRLTPSTIESLTGKFRA
ncbi:MAG: thiamine-binding protein [Dehalococcoidia bacterium]